MAALMNLDNMISEEFIKFQMTLFTQIVWLFMVNTLYYWGFSVNW